MTSHTAPAADTHPFHSGHFTERSMPSYFLPRSYAGERASELRRSLKDAQDTTIGFDRIPPLVRGLRWRIPCPKERSSEPEVESGLLLLANRRSSLRQRRKESPIRTEFA